MKDLNLIPKSYILAKQKRKSMLRRTIAFICGSIAAAVLILIPVYIKHNLQLEVDSYNKKAAQTDGNKVLLDKLDAVKQKFSEREKIAAGFNKDLFSAVTLLERLEKSVPHKLFVTELNIGSQNGGQVEITMAGMCATEYELASFITNLRGENYFSDITISSIKKSEALFNLASLPSAVENSSSASLENEKEKISPHFDFNISLRLKNK